MTNRRSISREISHHTGLEPRTTEKILRTYFTILSAAAKTGVGMGRLGSITYQENTVGIEPLQFSASKGTLVASKTGTLPPRVRHLVGNE